MDKDIYSTLADSRPLIALIYKIYAKNTIYKKRQLYSTGHWSFLSSPPPYQCSAVVPYQADQAMTNRYYIHRETSVLQTQMFYHYKGQLKNPLK